MIVVAIVGILAAVAYPSYQEYVRRGYRAESRSGLLQAQTWLERAATATGSYPNTLPGALQKVPSDRYTISYDNTTPASGYTLTATAQNAQANDKCGNYTLTSTSLRDVVNNTGSTTAQECWGK